MFLKNVPPVVAIHTEWRTCAPGKGYNLPLCFNDSASDSDLASTTGTPIPQKVQMIIESLRSTQSSVDMSDGVHVERTGHSSHESSRQPSRKGETGRPDTSGRSQRETTNQAHQTAGADFEPETQDSDSDDSVDRGIEEAIQEYLKGKVDHKRKAEPVSNPPSHAPKLQRKETDMPDPSRQQPHSDSNKVLTASNHVLKGIKGATQHLTTVKKHGKKKLSKENPFTQAKMTVKTLSSLGMKKESSSSVAETDCGAQPLLPVKVEDESLDSSSDDGIEEAIQRYQLEKERFEGKSEALKGSQVKEESDSSSDDGIEEAIRCYQQEKQKESKNSPLMPSPFVPMHQSKMTLLSSSQTSSESVKKVKPAKKNNNKQERDLKSSPTKPLSFSHALNRSPTDSLKGKRNSSSLTKPKEALTEHQPLSALKVSTTAELMCAEAILDISKAVMPAIDHTPFQANSSSLESISYTSAGHTDQSHNKSDESSVDSEEGIEQEIRKFLELKAKMHKQLPAPTMATVKDATKEKLVTTQSKAMRLSLTRKRKRKAESVDCKTKEPQLKPLAADASSPSSSSVSNSAMLAKSPSKQGSDHQKDLRHSLPSSDKSSSLFKSCKQSALRSPISSEREEPSGEKSSSLDSDEDLDAAIKDLLRTKKKVKKKVRDLKLKARKPVHSSSVSAIKKQRPTSKQNDDASTKVSSIKMSHLKSSKESTTLPKAVKGLKSKAVKSSSDRLQSNKKAKDPAQIAEPVKEKGNGEKTLDDKSAISRQMSPQLAEDSSSVDSDDSIEQEIRRFLAEKAKVSTTAVKLNQENIRHKAAQTTPFTKIAMKMENQQTDTPLDVDAGPTEGHCSGGEAQEGREMPKPFRRHSDVSERPSQMKGSTCSGEPDNDRRSLMCSSNAGKTLSLASRSVGSSATSPSSHPDIPPAVPGTSRSPGLRQSPLPINDPCLSATLVACEAKESTSAVPTDAPSSQRNRTRIPLREVLSAVCSSSAPVEKRPLTSPETPMVARSDRLATAAPVSRTEGFYMHNWIRRRRWDLPSTLPSTSQQHQTSTLRSTPTPTMWRTAGIVHMQRDQAAFVNLSAHKANHFQIKKREGGEREKQRQPFVDKARERKDDRREEEVHRERRVKEEVEEVCIDETDMESGDERRDQKKAEKRQELPSLSLSTSIDPGIVLSPYIAMDTEQRSRKYHQRMMHIRKQAWKGSAHESAKMVRGVKRRLQFVVSIPMRKRDDTGKQTTPT